MRDNHSPVSRSSYLTQALLLFLLVFLFMLVAGAIGALLLSFKYNIISPDLIPEYLQENQDTTFVIKLVQIFVHVMTFAIPALLFGLIVSFDPLKYLGLKRSPNILLIIFIPFITVLSVPGIEFLYKLNQSITFPESLYAVEIWLSDQAAGMEALMKAFLKMENVGDFIVNMVMLAIIPAIGEELLFRGAMQSLLIRWTKKPLVGILIASFLFSAMHLDFYGFFSRMALGILFGYLFYWSGNLWLPIIGHFIHNGIQVVLLYLKQMSVINFDVENMAPINWQITLFFTLLLTFFLILFYRKGKLKLTIE